MQQQLLHSDTSLPGRHFRAIDTPSLEAIYVAFDGSIKAVYHDNTLLVLSADSSSFTHVSPAGVRTVQLCEFCLSRFAPLLTELLDFRNQHVDVPAVCSPLLQQLQRSGHTFTLHFPITYTCWPATASEAFLQGLVELPDSTRIAVLSKCGYARIMLEYTGLRFAVRYPLLLAHDPACSSYTYAWQLQVFSRSQYPQRWQPALAVACAVAASAAHGFKLQDDVQLQLPQQLTDLTNHHHHHHHHHQQQQWQPGNPDAVPRASSACSSSPVHHCSPSRAAARGSSAYSSPRRFGSPLQQQHRAWQQQQQHGWESPASVLPGAPAVAWSPQCSRTRFQRQQAVMPGSAALRLAAAAGSPQAAAAAAAAAASAGSSACITQLPISTELQDSLPAYLRVPQLQQQLHHQRQLQQLPLKQQSAASNNDCISSSSSSSIAAGLAQALGHRQRLAASAAGAGRGWWLEPSLLLPCDELLQMVWMRDATVLFVQEVEEVEVWLHADDSCLFSFQAGAFVTHLLPRAAAAGWDTKAAAAAAGAPAAGGSSGAQWLPHAPAHGVPLSSWHEAGCGCAFSASAAGAAGAAAAAADCMEPLSLQLCRLRMPTGQGSSIGDAAAAGSVGLVDGLDAAGGPSATGALGAADGLVDGAIDASEMSRVYAASALPEVPIAAVAGGRSASSSIAVGCGGPALKLPVGQVAARALKFRSTMVRVKRCIASSAGTATHQQQQDQLDHKQQLPWPPHSTQHRITSLQEEPGQLCQQQQQEQRLDTHVLEEQDVPGVGIFTATRDGRVRVRFEDRTILNLDAGGERADLVLPDGSRRSVAAANPMGVEQYVQAALEFAAWARTSPAQRAAALHMQALVAAELHSSARMAAICDWGATQRLPAQAAKACSAVEAAEAAEAAEAVAGMGNSDVTWGAVRCSNGFEAAAGWQDAAVARCEWDGLGVAASRDVAQQDSGLGSWPGEGGKAGKVELQRLHRNVGSLSSRMAGLPAACEGAGASRQQAVEELLGANARLLQRLAG